MELKLSAYTRRSHSKILEGTTESALLMAFEMSHGHHDVGISNGSADLRSRAIFASAWHFFVIGSLETVSYYHICMDADSVESVLHSGIKMVDGIGTSTGVKGVAVGKERLST